MDAKAHLAKIETWDGSLATRLPRTIVECFSLKDGDDAEIVVVGGCESEQSCDSDRMNALKRLRVFRGRLPADFRFDRSEANER